MADEYTMTAQIPGPGDEVDEYTVMAEEADLDWADISSFVRFGFDGPPVGKILDVKQEGGKILVTAQVSLAELYKASDREIEFHPAFIVRKFGTKDGKRIIKAADLMHISMGFRYAPRIKPWWKKLWAWVRGLVRCAVDWPRERIDKWRR